jgi:hypothetical protein
VFTDTPEGTHLPSADWVLLQAKDVNDLASANLPLIGDTLTSCDHFDMASTSHWTGAAIIVK